MAYYFRLLRYRLALIYGLAALAIFSLAFLFSYLVVALRFEEMVAQRRTNQRLAVLRNISSLFLQQGSWREVREFAPSLLRFGIYRIRITDLQGRTRLDIQRKDMEQVMERDQHDQRNRVSMVESRFPFQVQDKKYGTAHIYTHSGSRLYSILDRLFLGEIGRIFIFAALISMLLFSLIALIISRSISRPIEKVATGALAITGGKLNVEIKVNGVLEVEDLARTFNLMARTLEDKEILQRKMTSDIAHELRTPVTILKSYLEGMNEGVLPMDRTSVQSLLEETGRLERIIQDLKAIWEFEKSTSRIQLERLNLTETIEYVIERFRQVAHESGVRLEYHHEKRPIHARVDREALARALFNLLTNGVKYGGDGGKLVVTLKEEGEHILIYVKDKGPGIPEKDLPYIFERFYRADASRTRKTGGAGLGLSITREALQAMKGSISARNNPDGGCCFTIRLPRG